MNSSGCKIDYFDVGIVLCLLAIERCGHLCVTLIRPCTIAILKTQTPARTWKRQSETVRG